MRSWKINNTLNHRICYTRLGANTNCKSQRHLQYEDFLEKSRKFPVRNKNFLRTRLNAGGIEVRLSSRRSWVRISAGEINFIFSKTSRPLLEPIQPSIQWILRALSLLTKRTWREFNHSPPTNVEVKERWSYNSLPPLFFIAWAGNSWIFTFIKYDIRNMEWRL